MISVGLPARLLYVVLLAVYALARRGTWRAGPRLLKDGFRTGYAELSGDGGSSH